MSRVSCKFRGKKNPDPNLYSSKKSPSKCWDVCNPEILENGGILETWNITLQGCNDPNGDSSIFPWTKWVWEEGCKHQSNNNMEEKISSSIKKKLEKKTVQHTLRKKCLLFFFLSGLIFLYAMICSFQSWVSFSQWFLCHVCSAFQVEISWKSVIFYP